MYLTKNTEARTDLNTNNLRPLKFFKHSSLTLNSEYYQAYNLSHHIESIL